MCDKDHFEEDLKKYLREGRVTRRDFGGLTAGAGLAMLLPRAANAQAVTETDVEIKTADGTCDAYFVHPSSGAHAAVLVWPDILGLRPAFRRWASGSPSRATRCSSSIRSTGRSARPWYRQARPSTRRRAASCSRSLRR